jgi:predicted RNase H-like HicB family nuclease
MKHYIAIFFENELGEWRVVFPDVPGFEAKRVTLDDAKFAAASALAQCIHENGSLPLQPMDMSAVQRSEEWLAQNDVDLSKAVVSMVPRPHRATQN